MPLEQPQAIRTIFFDAGFTLVRPHPSTSEICQRVCQQLHLHVHLDAVKARMHTAEDYFLQSSRRSRYIWASEETITEFWTDYYMHLLQPFVEENDESKLHQLAHAITEEFELHTSWATYPDVVHTLEMLSKQDYTLGVISDWGISLGPILRNLGLTQYFDTLLISATMRHAKPSTALYEQALQRANSIADYTLHIGDSYILDVLGARSAGITPVLLDRPGYLQERDVDCTLVHSLDEILALLEIKQA